MIIHPANIGVKFSPEGCAQAVFDIFFYEYTQAFQEEVNARCNVEACKSANEAAEREYKESNELGFGARLPYQTIDIEIKEREAKAASFRLKEAKAVMDFVRDTFLKEYALSIKQKEK